MEPIKAVARYANGRVIKGFTQDFLPNRDRFHLYPAAKPSGEATEVLVKELKAIFFVQDFVGNCLYQERKKYIEGEQPSGRKMEVTFVDGEVLVGSTWGMTRIDQASFSFQQIPRATILEYLQYPPQ